MEKVIYKDGDVEKTILIKKPGAKEKSEARIYSSKVFSELYNSKAVVLRSNLNAHLKEIGLWDDDKQKKLDSLNKEVETLENVFKRGGIAKSVARAKALELRKARNTRTFLLANTHTLDSRTLEGQVENSEFDALAAACILNDEGVRLFLTVDEYLDNSEKDHISEAAGKLARIVYELTDDFWATLEENKFLKQFGFVDDKLRLIDSNKNLIDENGKKINENGEFIDEDGNVISSSEGVKPEEFVPFTDE